VFGPKAHNTCPFDDGSVKESVKGISLSRMVPNLSELQHLQIYDMLLANCPLTAIADTVGCSEHSIFTI